MMRHTRAPQEGCGSSRVTCRRRRPLARVRMALLAVRLPSLRIASRRRATLKIHRRSLRGSPKSSSFPKQSMVGPSRNIDKSQPLYLQGDELIYDTGGNRVVARGNVEIYYNNYILTADQVVYDQSANTLTAVGNVVLKEPNGNIVRADRYTLTDDFRDGFVHRTVDRRRRRHAHRRRERDAPRRQHDRVHQRPLHALQNHRRHAAPVVLERGDRHPRPAGGDHQLSGRAVRAVRRADPLHALLRARRPVGEAQVRLPDAAASPTPTPSATASTIPYYFALAPNYDFTFYPMYTSRQGILWQGDWRHRHETASTTSRSPASIRIPPTCPRHRQPRPVRRLARQPRDQGPVLAVAAGGSSAGTSRSRATTRSAASTSSTTSC